MRFTQRGAMLIAAAITGLAPVTTAAAARHRRLRAGARAQAAKGCITVTATIPVGSVPYGVAVDPKTHTIYVANVSGDTVSVINGRTNTVTATIPVGNGPYGVAVDPDTRHRLRDQPRRQHGVGDQRATNTVTATIPVGSAPAGWRWTRRPTTIYVANDATTRCR